MFGIKNARRSARENEFVFGRRVVQQLSFGAPIWLGDDYIATRDHMIELTWPGNSLCSMRGKLLIA